MTQRRLPFLEFVCLMALLFSLIAYGTDAMLPAFGLIAQDFGLADENRAQLVVSAFVLGTGAGQLIAGPLSDSFGRKPVLLCGIALFAVMAVVAVLAPSLQWLLVARFFQGLGVSAPRAVGQAMVRDLYEGRLMARVVSLAMMFFVLVPAIAPFAGQWLMLRFGWEAIFISFVGFGALSAAWLTLRQGETLLPDRRRAFALSSILDAFLTVMRNRRAVVSMLVITCGMACIFAYLNSAKQVFVDWLGTGTDFPAYFALIALISGAASALNAWLVVRFGMWFLATLALAVLASVSLIYAVVLGSGIPQAALLWSFVGWSSLMFLCASMVLANLNAFALEHLGDVAGMAAALIGAVTTICCIAIAAPIGLAFNGTGLPLILGVAACAGLGFFVNLFNPR